MEQIIIKSILIGFTGKNIYHFWDISAKNILIKSNCEEHQAIPY